MMVLQHTCQLDCTTRNPRLAEPSRHFLATVWRVQNEIYEQTASSKTKVGSTHLPDSDTCVTYLVFIPNARAMHKLENTLIEKWHKCHSTSRRSRVVGVRVE